jgi:hypothetical protein
MPETFSSQALEFIRGFKELGSHIAQLKTADLKGIRTPVPTPDLKPQQDGGGGEERSVV